MKNCVLRFNNKAERSYWCRELVRLDIRFPSGSDIYAYPELDAFLILSNIVYTDGLHYIKVSHPTVPHMYPSNNNFLNNFK